MSVLAYSIIEAGDALTPLGRRADPYGLLWDSDASAIHRRLAALDDLRSEAGIDAKRLAEYGHSPSSYRRALRRLEAGIGQGSRGLEDVMPPELPAWTVPLGVAGGVATSSLVGHRGGKLALSALLSGLTSGGLLGYNRWQRRRLASAIKYMRDQAKRE